MASKLGKRCTIVYGKLSSVPFNILSSVYRTIIIITEVYNNYLDFNRVYGPNPLFLILKHFNAMYVFYLHIAFCRVFVFQKTFNGHPLDRNLGL